LIITNIILISNAQTILNINNSSVTNESNYGSSLNINGLPSSVRLCQDLMQKYDNDNKNSKILYNQFTYIPPNNVLDGGLSSQMSNISSGTTNENELVQRLAEQREKERIQKEQKEKEKINNIVNTIVGNTSNLIPPNTIIPLSTNTTPPPITTPTITTPIITTPPITTPPITTPPITTPPITTTNTITVQKSDDKNLSITYEGIKYDI
jgi:hypothetical protein